MVISALWTAEELQCLDCVRSFYLFIYLFFFVDLHLRWCLEALPSTRHNAAINRRGTSYTYRKYRFMHYSVCGLLAATRQDRRERGSKCLRYGQRVEGCVPVECSYLPNE